MQGEQHGLRREVPLKSKNPKKGTDPFINERVIYLTTGSLQLIPPSYDSDYEAAPYHTGSGETQVPVLDSRDWSLDYFNGIFFQQDPPATGDSTSNPRYIDAYVYIGEYLDKGVFTQGISGSLTNLHDGSSYLVAGSNVTITSASNGQISIASTGGGGSSTDRKKNVYFITQTKSAGVSIVLSSNNFTPLSYDPNIIDFFVNGQLLHSGSAAQVSAKTRDYHLDTSGSVKFSFDLYADDIIDVITFE